MRVDVSENHYANIYEYIFKDTDSSNRSFLPCKITHNTISHRSINICIRINGDTVLFYKQENSDEKMDTRNIISASDLSDQ